MARINISEEERKLKILKISRWMVENRASFGDASEQFKVPITTIKRWFKKYIENIDLNLYNEMNMLLSWNSKRNMERQLRINEGILRFANFILNHPENLSLNKYIELYDENIERKSMTQKIYHMLFYLDKTPDKNFYFSVMNKLKISTNGCSKINDVIEMQREKLQTAQKASNYGTYSSNNIESKIIQCARSLVKKEKTIEELASIYETDTKNIETALREVLPFIDSELYNKLTNIYFHCDTKVKRKILD